MAAYPYHPGLKGPSGSQYPDFTDPKLAPLLRMMLRGLQASVRAWTPPEGVAFRQYCCPPSGGTQIVCFIVEPAAASAQCLPGMLYCHGGGFFLPLQVSALQLAAHYAARLHMRVFLPEYRLLPEYPAPAAFHDCLAVWRQMTLQADALGLDADRLLLYGESAGGTLAAGSAQQIREEGKAQPAGQLLIYPALDDRCCRYASVTRYADAAWPRRSHEHMWREYLRGISSPCAPLVPLRADSAALAGLPPTYIEPQEIDILRDEALTYAQALASAGVAVQLNEVSGSYHGFDAEWNSAFVQQIVRQRVCAMETMLDRPGRHEPTAGNNLRHTL